MDNSLMAKDNIQDVHIYFPLEVYEALKRMAKENRRSISGEVILAVEKQLKEHAKAKPSNL